MAYFKGSSIRCFTRFSNPVTGAAVDPTNVYFKYVSPTGVASTLHYGVDPSVQKDSTGNYHVDLSPTELGTYEWCWYSTGTGQAVDQGTFEIKASLVP